MTVPSPSPNPHHHGGVTPTRSPGVPDGPLARWLRHPGATQRHWLHELLAHLSAVGRAALPLVLAVAISLAALAVLLLVARAVRAHCAATGARWLAIVPPAEVEPSNGVAWWRLLSPLLTSRGLLAGRRPPVTLEIVSYARGTRVGLWTSATLSADAVRRAVETAWPGARVAVGDPPRLLRVGRPVTGARLRMSAPEWFPLGGSQDTTDPLRGVLSALAGGRDDELAVLQILARPASRHCLRRARRAAWATRTGRPSSRTARILESLHSQRRPALTASAADPYWLDDVREITAKTTDGPHFQVAVRYGVAGGGPGLAGRRRRRGRCREMASGSACTPGRNHLLAQRLPRPARALNGRRLGRGFLCSLSELAALAHLPAEATRYRISMAPSRLVAPIPDVRHG